MNIILVSSRLAKTRSIALSNWQILFVLLPLFGLMLMAAVILQHAPARFAPEGLKDGLRAMLFRPQSDDQQKQQPYLYGGLDARAPRVGQAQVQPLDAQSACLTNLTVMRPEEFRIDQPPAQGGPLVIAPAQELMAGNLDRQLNGLMQLVNVRSDKLMVFEAMLIRNQPGCKLFPPVLPNKENWRSANFGWRIDPFTGTNAMHEGVDYMAPQGTLIRASAGGVVTYSDNHSQYGNMIEIDHGNDIVTRYAHASRLLVKVGQVVWRGEKIAEVGSTGRSTGSHLHFEVRHKGIAQNPARFLQNAAS